MDTVLSNAGKHGLKQITFSSTTNKADLVQKI
jgi:hypothetical protein